MTHELLPLRMAADFKIKAGFRHADSKLQSRMERQLRSYFPVKIWAKEPFTLPVHMQPDQLSLAAINLKASD